MRSGSNQLALVPRGQVHTENIHNGDLYCVVFILLLSSVLPLYRVVMLVLKAGIRSSGCFFSLKFPHTPRTVFRWHHMRL